jgi:hypothetical protein
VSGPGLAGKDIEAGSASGSGLAGKAILAGSFASLLEASEPCPEIGPVTLDGNTCESALPDKSLSQFVNHYRNRENVIVHSRTHLASTLWSSSKPESENSSRGFPTEIDLSSSKLDLDDER